VFLHINWKEHTAYDINYIVNSEGLKVRGSHIHWKSYNVLEMVLERDVVTTGH